jgi:hypothetical protein
MKDALLFAAALVCWSGRVSAWRESASAPFTYDTKT